MRHKYADEIKAQQIICDNKTFFLMVKEVLGGVILYKYAAELVNDLSHKVSKWEKYGIVKTYKIGGNKLIVLLKNKYLELSYTPKPTPTLITRSCLRMDKFLCGGYDTPEEIYNRAMKGGDRAAFGGHFTEDVLTRQQRVLSDRGIKLDLANAENIATLEKLKGHNVFFDGIGYNVNEAKNEVVIRPTFSYYLVFGEKHNKVSKILYDTYAACYGIFSCTPENIKVKPRFRVYHYGSGKILKDKVFRVLTKKTEFRGHPEILENTFTFTDFRNPFSYIDIRNIV